MRRTDCKILESDYVFRYRRSDNMLRMAEEEHGREKLYYGADTGTL